MIYADYFNLICITYISYCNIAVTVQIHTHTYTYCIYFFSCLQVIMLNLVLHPFIKT